MAFAAEESAGLSGHFLYVAAPGIRDELQHGGQGVIVFDVDAGHKFVKRIACGGVDESNDHVLNIKGICASAETRRLYVSTIKTLVCMDLVADKVVWEKAYEGGCDRMAISPNGKIIYLPSLEKDYWNVVDAASGAVIKKIVTHSGAHNTIIGGDGKFAYLAGLKSPILRVSDMSTHEIIREIGPFGNFIRPFTINGAQTRCYVNVDGLLGFEIGDLQTGAMLSRVEVHGFQKGPTKRHGCPSHGIGLTPDEKEIWLCDSANSSIHIFDNTMMPPRQLASITVCDQPGWITFGIDGRYAYPSSGEVIDVKSRQIVGHLADEVGAAAQSEKMVPIDFEQGLPVRVGSQFAIGRVSR